MLLVPGDFWSHRGLNQYNQDIYVFEAVAVMGFPGSGWVCYSMGTRLGMFRTKEEAMRMGFMYLMQGVHPIQTIGN